MKYILNLLIILISFNGFAQNAPKTHSKIQFGETLYVKTIELKFIKVLSDSRCPKTVSCIRAGEAEILVAIYENGVFLKEQKLTFYPLAYKNDALSLYVSKNLKISGINLFPYPINPDKISNKDYFVEVLIEY